MTTKSIEELMKLMRKYDVSCLQTEGVTIQMGKAKPPIIEEKPVIEDHEAFKPKTSQLDELFNGMRTGNFR